MSASPPSPSALRVAKLSQSGPTPFALTPDKDEMAQWATQLGLSGLRKLSLKGQVAPAGKAAWTVKATLGATLIQPCVLTLEPVTTRIDVEVQRQFQREVDTPEDEEFELPEDDLPERLGVWIDPKDIMIEALSLHIPEYPRHADATLETAQFSQKGVKPMTDEDARPFAGLAALKGQLKPDNQD